MKKMTLFITIILVSFLAFASTTSKNVARVKVKRGSAVFVAPDGTKAEIKKNMWIKEGTVITTGKKSFVRLSFIDKSSMNIGPKSKLKIEKFSKEEAGVINVFTGKIRSKVTKDYLKIDKDKSKLFIKSKSAVMGIRGTDFIFSTNAKTGSSTAVLFEGSVVFSKLGRGDNLSDLERIVDKGRRINPGQFSVASIRNSRATVPSKMSSKQFKGLEKNTTFKSSDPSKKAKKVKSVVPPGLSGEIILTNNDNLATEIKQVTNVDISKKVTETDSTSLKESKGFVNGEDIKPVDGSIVHIDSGAIIPLGVDSQYDPNAGEWVSNSVGAVDSTGTYLPPEGFSMTDDGNLLKTDTVSGKIKEVIIGDVKGLDDVKPLEQIEVKEFQNTKDEKSVKESNNKSKNEEKDSKQEVDTSDQVTEPVGEASSGQLPPPPLPSGGCSTCNQPVTFTPGGAPPPPPQGRTRLKARAIKN